METARKNSWARVKEGRLYRGHPPFQAKNDYRNPLGIKRLREFPPPQEKRIPDHLARVAIHELVPTDGAPLEVTIESGDTVYGTHQAELFKQ